MAHSVILLLQMLECARQLAIAAGDTALAKKIENLMSVVQALHDKLEAGLVPPLQVDAAHDALERAQDLAVDMCDNQNIQNRVSDVQTATNDINQFLP